MSSIIETSKISIEHFPVELSCASWLGLKEIMDDDKIPALLRLIRKATSKNIVGILCNCQGEVLFEMLKKQRKFLKKISCFCCPFIKKKSLHFINEAIFCEFDFFIYQLYFDGYFPQITHIDMPENVLLSDDNGDAIFWCRDYFIEDIYSQVIKQTVEMLLREDETYCTKEVIRDRWNMAVQRMIVAEEIVDLRMSDYILKNIKKKNLFYTAHHPVNELIYEETKRLMELFEFPFEKFDYINILNFESSQQIVYPYVKKVLGLEYREDTYYANKGFIDRKYKIDEYIELYIRNICEFD